MPLQCFGLVVVALGQALMDDWQFGPQPAHREINTYSIGQLLPLVLALDHTGEYQSGRSRIETVTGDAPQVPQEQAEVETVTRRRGPRLPQPVEVEHHMRGSGVGKKVAHRLGNTGLSHTDSAVDQEGLSTPSNDCTHPGSVYLYAGDRLLALRDLQSAVQAPSAEAVT